MSTLDCITERLLRSLAGDTWFARGEAYQQEGRVINLSARDNRLLATVTGTREYFVQLSCRQAKLTYTCTCPIGDEGNFCKHCVAVGLAWLDQEKPSAAASQAKFSLKDFLSTLDREELVGIITDEASNNRRLRDHLELEAARKSLAGVDLSLFRKAITRATRTADVNYYSMGRFARRVTEVAESVRALLEDGHFHAVIELTEYCFKRLEKATGEVDDSDGYLGGLFSDFIGLHHTACLASEEDPLTLAQRLFDWELNSEWDFFSGAVARYLDVLGEKGLLEYRRLAESHWSKVPELKPNDKDDERWSGRFRITSIMESLAFASGDLDALIEIKKRDLSHPYSFLEIAELYRNARQYDAALEWAEKGAYSFEAVDWRISDFLATEYHRRGRHAEAMNLIWTHFLENPGVEMYKHLHANAALVKSSCRDGSEWHYWREQALQHLRGRLGTLSQSEVRFSFHSPDLVVDGIKISHPWRSQGDRSVLVEIFLWEKNYNDAWREAVDGGCNARLWLELADKIASDYPEKAYRIYKALIGPAVESTNNTAYDEAIKLLTKMRKLASCLNREAEFAHYVVALRGQYKRKRNFIKLLDTTRALNDR